MLEHSSSPHSQTSYRWAASVFRRKISLENQLILATLLRDIAIELGYIGNILNLLRHLKTDLSGYDFLI